MKINKLLLFFLLTASNYVLIGQNVDLNVVSTAGNTDNNSTNSISWTLGEVSYVGGANEHIKLTEGFIQPTLDLKSGISNISEEINVSIYPNPTAHFINVKLTDSPALYNVKLFTINGQYVNSWEFKNSLIIDLSLYASGNYFLEIINTKTKENNTYQISKIN